MLLKGRLFWKILEDKTEGLEGTFGEKIKCPCL